MKRIAVVFIIVVFSYLFYFPFTAQSQTEQVSPPAVDDTSRILVLSSAFEALGKIGVKQGKYILIQGLKSKEFFLRARAADALGKFQDKEVDREIYPLLLEEKALKGYAIQAIRRLNEKELIPLLRKLVSDEDYIVVILATKTLIELGDSSMEKVLLEFLDNKDGGIRANVTEMLGDFGDKYLPRLLTILAGDPSPIVRQKAIEQLGRHNYAPADSLIRKALEDKNAPIRQAACMAISQIEGAKAIPLLLERLKDQDVAVRATAKVELSLKGEQSIIKLCWDEIENPDPVLRTSSYVALANFKDINILPVLLKENVAQENQGMVRQVTARALMILKPHVYELIEKSLLKSKIDVFSVGDLAFDYKVQGKSLTQITIEALKDEKNPLHADAPFLVKELQEKTALPALRESLLSDKDPNMVANIAFVLGEMQDQDAVSYLIKLCEKYGL